MARVRRLNEYRARQHGVRDVSVLVNRFHNRTAGTTLLCQRTHQFRADQFVKVRIIGKVKLVNVDRLDSFASRGLCVKQRSPKEQQRKKDLHSALIDRQGCKMYGTAKGRVDRLVFALRPVAWGASG